MNQEEKFDIIKCIENLDHNFPLYSDVFGFIPPSKWYISNNDRFVINYRYTVDGVSMTSSAIINRYGQLADGGKCIIFPGEGGSWELFAEETKNDKQLYVKNKVNKPVDISDDVPDIKVFVHNGKRNDESIKDFQDDILEKLNNHSFMDDWKKYEEEKHKKEQEKREQEKNDFIDQFKLRRNPGFYDDEYMLSRDINDVFRMIGETLYKMQQSINFKQDRTIRLGESL